jgi:hypothetical protein
VGGGGLDPERPDEPHDHGHRASLVP